MNYHPDGPRTPYHLEKSEDRSMPYLYSGRCCSRSGWVAHKLVVYVARPADAERLRHSVPGMRVDRVAPLRIARAPQTLEEDDALMERYKRFIRSEDFGRKPMPLALEEAEAEAEAEAERREHILRDLRAASLSARDLHRGSGRFIHVTQESLMDLLAEGVIELVDPTNPGDEGLWRLAAKKK